MIIHACGLKWKINKYTNHYWILKNKLYVTFLFGSTSLNFAIFQKLQIHYSLLRKAQYFRIPGAAVEKEHYWQQKLRQLRTYGNKCSCSHMCTHIQASLSMLLLGMACTHGELATSLSLGPKGLHTHRTLQLLTQWGFKLQRNLVAVSIGRGWVHFSFAWFYMLRKCELA